VAVDKLYTQAAEFYERLRELRAKQQALKRLLPFFTALLQSHAYCENTECAFCVQHAFLLCKTRTRFCYAKYAALRAFYQMLLQWD
jgi:hypothetical protein